MINNNINMHEWRERITSILPPPPSNPRDSFAPYSFFSWSSPHDKPTVPVYLISVSHRHRSIQVHILFDSWQHASEAGVSALWYLPCRARVCTVLYSPNNVLKFVYVIWTVRSFFNSSFHSWFLFCFCFFNLLPPSNSSFRYHISSKLRSQL